MSADTNQAHNAPDLRCIATTGNTFCEGILERNVQRQPCASGNAENLESNCFKEAQFSPDGTTVVTHSEDQRLRTFLLPPDLLVEQNQPHNLEAYDTHSSPTPIQSYAIHPHFSLADLNTTMMLSCATDLPIRLRSVFDYDHYYASYSFVDANTEEYIAPTSLAFINDGQQFVAGGQARIAIFDISRNGSGPILVHKTKSPRAVYGEPSMRCSGRIMALDVSRDGVLAAGSTNRNIGLFGASGHGQCESRFSIQPESELKGELRGSGVTALKWSPCGRYLLSAERQSDVVQIYDVRGSFRRLGWLSGRKADTTQRMGIDVVHIAEGFEVWAGGQDGRVRMWINPGSVEGEQTPDADISMHEDTVSSAVWHPGASILATCSGQRFRRESSLASPSSYSGSDSESDSGQPDESSGEDNSLVDTATLRREDAPTLDNTMRIWTL